MFLLRSRNEAKQKKNSYLEGKRILTVAHNHPEFFPGGGEILAYQLFNGFREAGLESYFMAATGRINRVAHAGTSLLAMQGKADEFLFHNDYFDYFHQSHRNPMMLAQEWPRFLEELKPDIVHFHHTLRYGMEVLSLTRRILPEAKILYTLHDYIPICHRDGQMVRKTDDSLCESASPEKCNGCFPDRSPAQLGLRQRFIKTHFDTVDVFIAPSNFLAQRYIDWGISAEKIDVLQNGTLETESAPHRALKRNESRNRFAFLGQISPYKGTLLLVEAARLLKEKGITDFSVAIHGIVDMQSEEFQQQFKRAVADMAPQVRTFGTYKREELKDIMADADWVVMPSIWWENAPLVINEAFAHRRPVICSNIGGMAEKVEHEVNGLHFRVGNAGSLADAMERAISEEGLWQELTAAIVPPASMETCVQDHMNLLATLYASAEEPEERKRA